jgi:D-glycerate 3-kinase
MLGFKPLPNEVVKEVDPQASFLSDFVCFLLIFTCSNSMSLFYLWVFQLEVVNKNLEAYSDAWDRFIQSWIVIKIREPGSVYQWRLQVIT